MKIIYTTILLFIIIGSANAQNAIEITAMGGYQFGGSYTVETAKIKLDNTGTAGFTIDQCNVKPVDEIPMDAIYLEGTKNENGYKKWKQNKLS